MTGAGAGRLRGTHRNSPTMYLRNCKNKMFVLTQQSAVSFARWLPYVGVILFVRLRGKGKSSVLCIWQYYLFFSTFSPEKLGYLGRGVYFWMDALMDGRTDGRAYSGGLVPNKVPLIFLWLRNPKRSQDVHLFYSFL